MTTKTVQPETLRITDQYRRRPSGRVCEIESFGARLCLHVWELETPLEPGWRVEAHSGSGTDAIIVGRSAGTRVEALRDVGTTWAAERRSPSFDWENIAALLASVRVV
jgi:hypothetical protein